MFNSALESPESVEENGIFRFAKKTRNRKAKFKTKLPELYLFRFWTVAICSIISTKVIAVDRVLRASQLHSLESFWRFTGSRNASKPEQMS